MAENLFERFQLGEAWLANRMVVAAMTRNRADENGVISPLAATYEAVSTTSYGGDAKGDTDYPAHAQEQAG